MLLILRTIFVLPFNTLFFTHTTPLQPLKSIQNTAEDLQGFYSVSTSFFFLIEQCKLFIRSKLFQWRLAKGKKNNSKCPKYKFLLFHTFSAAPINSLI